MSASDANRDIARGMGFDDEYGDNIDSGGGLFYSECSRVCGWVWTPAIEISTENVRV